MKYIIFSIIFLIVVIERTFPQENHFTVRTGAGYYMDTFTADDGSIFWLEGGYKLNTGFIASARVSMASLDWRIRTGVFEGYETIQLRQMADVIFSKPFALKGQHFLEPGIGFKLKREYLLKPDVDIVNNSGSTILYTQYSDIFYEIGFTICLDYYYQFQSNFYMGLRADANVIWALGFEGLTLSPLFGFRF